jgi:hypothetical protein
MSPKPFKHFRGESRYSGGGRWPNSAVAQELESRPDGNEILAYRIPEAPYSDRAFEFLHNAFDVTHGVLATLEIFGVELAGLGVVGLGLTVLGPIAAFFGSFMALGIGTAQARADISRKRVKMGFAEGFAAGADDASWKFVKSLFWEGKPEFNAFDEEAGAIAQKAKNVGVAAGFVQGRKLSEKQRIFFWQSLAKELTPGDRAYYAGDHKKWPRLVWEDYYIKMAALFIKLYAKD